MTLIAESGVEVYSSIARRKTSVAEILEKVKFVINPSGKKSGVMVDLDIWEQIVGMLEDLEDAEEVKRARAVREESVPWNTAKKELNLGE